MGFLARSLRNGEVFAERRGHNAISNQGMRQLVAGHLELTAVLRVWKLGLIDGSVGAEANWTDTLASHAGWTAYTAAGTPDYNSANPVVGGVLTPSAVSTFTFTEAKKIAGFYLYFGSVLFSTGIWAAAVQYNPSDTLELTYEINNTLS